MSVRTRTVTSDNPWCHPLLQSLERCEEDGEPGQLVLAGGCGIFHLDPYLVLCSPPSPPIRGTMPRGLASTHTDKALGREHQDQPGPSKSSARASLRAWVGEGATPPVPAAKSLGHPHPGPPGTPLGGVATSRSPPQSAWVPSSPQSKGEAENPHLSPWGL